jgi:hypothetical protein
MYWRIPIIGVLALFVAVSCDQQPVEPRQDDLGATLSKVIHDSWVDTWDASGNLEWVECANDGAGENLATFGTFDIHYRSRTTPSGNVIWQWKFDYWTDTPSSFVGQDSGDVYSLVSAEDNGGSVIKAKGTQYHEHWQANERYVNQDGQRIHLRAKFALTIDANGEVQVERLVWGWKCSK